MAAPVNTQDKPVVEQDFAIYVLKGQGKKQHWALRTVVSKTPKGRVLKNENDALRYGYGLRGTHPRKGECMSASGKRFKAVKVAK